MTYADTISLDLNRLSGGKTVCQLTEVKRT